MLRLVMKFGLGQHLIKFHWLFVLSDVYVIVVSIKIRLKYSTTKNDFGVNCSSSVMQYTPLWVDHSKCMIDDFGWHSKYWVTNVWCILSNLFCVIKRVLFYNIIYRLGNNQSQHDSLNWPAKSTRHMHSNRKSRFKSM